MHKLPVWLYHPLKAGNFFVIRSARAFDFDNSYTGNPVSFCFAYNEV